MSAAEICNCSGEPKGHFASRRSVVAAFACTIVLPAMSRFAQGAAAADDERFMRIALEEARQASFPFGAVIVRDGQRDRARAQSQPGHR